MVYRLYIALYAFLPQYLLFQIPLTIYLAWKAEKVIAQQRPSTPQPQAEEEALSPDDDKHSDCCKSKEVTVDQPTPTPLKILKTISSNKFFISLMIFHSFTVVISIFFSGILSAIFSIRSWCIPFAVYLRYRVGLLTECELQY